MDANAFLIEQLQSDSCAAVPFPSTCLLFSFRNETGSCAPPSTWYANPHNVLFSFLEGELNKEEEGEGEGDEEGGRGGGDEDETSFMSAPCHRLGLGVSNLFIFFKHPAPSSNPVERPTPPRSSKALKASLEVVALL
jgi:hypothetical protein